MGHNLKLKFFVKPDQQWIVIRSRANKRIFMIFRMRRFLYLSLTCLEKEWQILSEFGSSGRFPKLKTVEGSFDGVIPRYGRVCHNCMIMSLFFTLEFWTWKGRVYWSLRFCPFRGCFWYTLSKLAICQMLPLNTWFRRSPFNRMVITGGGCAMEQSLVANAGGLGF